MCVMSMVGDEFSERWNKYLRPPITTSPGTGTINIPYPGISQTFTTPMVSKQEFDDLKKEVELMKSLLKRAKIYDEQNNEPNCEMEDKVALLKKIAEFVGIDLSEIFGDVPKTKKKQKLHD